MRVLYLTITVRKKIGKSKGINGSAEVKEAGKEKRANVYGKAE